MRACAGAGPTAHAALLLLLGSTLAGLDNLSSGATSGAVNEIVGGSTRTLASIVGALSGLSSLASSAYLLAVPPFLARTGSVRHLFVVNAAMAAGASVLLLAKARTRVAYRPDGSRPEHAKQE